MVTHHGSLYRAVLQKSTETKTISPGNHVPTLVVLRGVATVVMRSLIYLDNNEVTIKY